MGILLERDSCPWGEGLSRTTDNFGRSRSFESLFDPEQE